MSAADPFTFLVDALWEVLEGNTDFASLVSSPNRIKLDSKFQPFKKALVEASVPEVTILPAGKRFFDENDCSGATVVQKLHITITSGLKNTSSLFPVEWVIAQAIYTALNADTDNLYDELWESEKIIKSVQFFDLEEGLSYDDLNRDLKGWAAILPIEVKLRFSAELLGVE